MSCFFKSIFSPPPVHHKGNHAGTLWTEHNNPTVISFHQKPTKRNSALDHLVVQPDQLEWRERWEKRSMVGAMTAQIGLKGVVDNIQPLNVEAAASFL